MQMCQSEYNSTKDVTREMTPFASLRLRVKLRTQRREDAKTQRTKIAVYAGVEYRYKLPEHVR